MVRKVVLTLVVAVPVALVISEINHLAFFVSADVRNGDYSMLAYTAALLLVPTPVKFANLLWMLSGQN